MSDHNVKASGEGGLLQERKNLLLFGGVGAAVLLAVAAYFLLLSGGSDDVASGAVPSASNNGAAASSASASPSASATGSGSDVPVYPADVGRNPFKSLYPPIPTAPAKQPAVDKAAATTDATTSNANTNTNSGGTSTPAKQTTPSDDTTARTVTVKLINVVDEDTVLVKVDNGRTTAYDKDQVFAGAFSLWTTRPDEGEATFHFGDGSPFTLNEGQSKKVVVTS